MAGAKAGASGKVNTGRLVFPPRQLLPGACAGATIAAILALSIVKGEETPPSGASSPSIWAGVYSPEQVGRGKKGYNSQCARCHGENLLGGEDSPALVDKFFLKEWAGKSVGALVEYTRTEMPSDGPGKLSRKLCIDITAYVLSANGYPTGKSELGPDEEMLEKILIEPKK